MDQINANYNRYYKCPHCACIFMSQADLQKHTQVFGADKAMHESEYRRTHGRIEHGYSSE
jgi:uncharacterized C2H2 Zn-finger protein